MDRQKYLERIGLSEAEVSIDVAGLNLLQRRHLLRIPFENLSIHWKQPIVPDIASFYRKVIENKRGGFCYELNGLFNTLLTELGFKSRMVSARVANDSADGFGAEYDHMAVIVDLGGEEYLADVGFGAFAAEPLRLELNIEQEDATGTYRISQYNQEYLLVARKDGDAWRNEYIFTVKPRELTEFAGMCEFHQTSPESHFTKNKVCSLMTATGRKTLTDSRYIETSDGERSETPVADEADFNRLLKAEFNIEPIN